LINTTKFKIRKRKGNSIFNSKPLKWHHDIFDKDLEPFSVKEVELFKKLADHSNKN
tara:strand:+ start:306 stop:473 length:168 start_codon:yes stop_codon:yes gene_type:complete